MGLFSGSENIHLGIDIGTNSIKLAEVEVNKDGPGILKNYSITDFATSENINIRNVEEQQLGQTIKHVYSKLGSKTTKCGISIGTSESFTVFLNMPWIQDQDMERAVSYEVKKYIPVDVSEVRLLFDVIKRDPVGRKMVVLVVAVPYSVISKYKTITRIAGLELITLEVENFSTARTLLGKNPGTTLLVDMGAMQSTIGISKDGQIIFNSSIDIGGKHITDMISNKLNTTPQRAEMIKVSEGLNGSSKEPIQTIVDRLINSIKSTVVSFEKKNNEKVDQILFIGANTLMPGLGNYIQSAFSIYKYVNPTSFPSVELPKNVPPPLAQNLIHRLSVAIGLALKVED